MCNLQSPSFDCYNNDVTSVKKIVLCRGTHQTPTDSGGPTGHWTSAVLVVDSQFDCTRLLYQFTTGTKAFVHTQSTTNHSLRLSVSRQNRATINSSSSNSTPHTLENHHPQQLQTSCFLPSSRETKNKNEHKRNQFFLSVSFDLRPPTT